MSTPDIMFDFSANMRQGNNLVPVNPKFTKALVMVEHPVASCEYGCCLRVGSANDFIPRHKLLGYDFQTTEWNCGFCTPFMRCCCGEFKGLTIETSDKDVTGSPLALSFYQPITGPGFSKDLPGQIKSYIFKSLDGVGEKAQLISHMIEDGIVDSAGIQLNFKLSEEMSEQAGQTELEEPLFSVAYGTKGVGKYSSIKFFPSYVAMDYGNNTTCLGGMCCNPFQLQTHDMVVPRFKVVGYNSLESDLCGGLCCCCKSSSLVIRTSERAYFCPQFCGKKLEYTKVHSVASDKGLDHAALMSYVYGPIQDSTTALHATNHLIGSRLAGPIKISESLSGFLSPSANAIKGRKI